MMDFRMMNLAWTSIFVFCLRDWIMIALILFLSLSYRDCENTLHVLGIEDFVKEVFYYVYFSCYLFYLLLNEGEMRIVIYCNNSLFFLRTTYEYKLNG